MTLVGLNSGLTIANETAITKEGSRHLRNDSESHTTSLLDNRERNYRQSSVIVCSLLSERVIDDRGRLSDLGRRCRIRGQSGSNVHTKTNETFRSEFFPVFAGLVVLIGDIRHMIPNVIFESFDLAHFCRE